MMRTEREIELQVMLVVACDYLAWALDYARRVAQHQVAAADTERIRDLRMFIQQVRNTLQEVMPK
jgi:hypothetical protein